MPIIEEKIIDIDKEAVQAEQEAHFDEVKETIMIGTEAKEVKRQEYKQVLPTKDSLQWVDVYDGEQGKGYVVMEKKIDNGKTFIKATNFGAEEWRTHDWEPVSDGKI